MTAQRHAAFTLVEMLVSTAVVLLLISIMIAAVSQVSSVWQRAVAKGEQFREARDGFDGMTTRLAQATLDVHWEYDNPALPTKYRRDSNLRFISGPANQLIGAPTGGRAWPTHAVFFEAPLGLSENTAHRGFENLMCTCGYYLEVGDDSRLRPAFLPASKVPVRVRPRLMEMWHPTERNTIYQLTGGTMGATYVGRDWFCGPLGGTTPPVHVLAENIVALIITPRLAPADEAEVLGSSATANPDFSPLAPAYLYDSSPVTAANRGDSRYLDGRLNPVHQLPPMLQVSMVVVDEKSISRLGYSTAQLDPLSLAGKPSKPAKFQNTGSYSKDMLVTGGAESVETQLIARHLNYRIFTSNVVIRAAKWSREQTETLPP